MKGDPCQKEACAIQTCLQGRFYNLFCKFDYL